MARIIGFVLMAAMCSLAGAGEPAPAPARIYDEDGDKVFESLRERINASTPDEVIPVIVQYRESATRNELRASAAYQLARQRLKYDYRYVAALATSLTPQEIEIVRQDPLVSSVELDGEVKAFLSSEDTFWGVEPLWTQFGFTGDRDGQKKSFSKDDVVIAVIDTGVNDKLVDLKGHVLFWKDYVQRRPDPYDDHGHGTAVCDIAVGSQKGQGDSGIHLGGVAPGAALVIFKVLDKYGRGSSSDVIAAIDECIARKSRYGIRVINLSLGMAGSSDGKDAQSIACNRAVERGIVVVCAAGNAGPARRTIGSPAASQAAITVGAGGGFNPSWQLSLCDFSSRGPTADGRVKPDIWAPGRHVMALTQIGFGEWRYLSVWSGTSMAAPFVSGLVALMLDANPAIAPAKVKEILASNAQPWFPGDPSNESGFGRVQPYQSVTQAAGITEGLQPPEGPALFVKEGQIGAGEEVTIGLDVALGDGLFSPTATVLMLNYPGGDIDILAESPSGVIEIARTKLRQETVEFPFFEPGRYLLHLRSCFDATGYQLVASAAGFVP